MSDDLIKRSDAIEALCDITNNSDMQEDWHRGISVSISALYRVPSADRPSAVDLSSVYSTAYKSGYEKGKADRPQGEWIEVEEDWRHQIEFWKCSECDFAVSSRYNFCPNCGADMKGADDE